MATNEGEASKRRNNEHGDAEKEDATIGLSADDQKSSVDLQNRSKANGKVQTVVATFEGKKRINYRYVSVAHWVSYISEPYNTAKYYLIETGSRLVRAEQDLDHQKLSDVYSRLGFSSRRAQQLKELYRYFGDLDTEKLPNTDRALNELKKLDHDQLHQAIQKGEIHQGLKTKDAQAVVQRYREENNDAPSSSKTTKYMLGHLRRLISAFETVSDDEFKDTVERLRDDEREKLRRTLEALERHLEARHGADEK